MIPELGQFALILALPWYAYIAVLVGGVALLVSGVISPARAELTLEQA